MKTILKTCLLFVAIVFFLSINVKGKTLFSHIHTWIAPVTNLAQDKTQEFLDSTIHGTKSYTKKIFDNSVPKVRDSLKTKMSGIKKDVNEPAEKILIEEKEQLDELIKSHR